MVQSAFEKVGQALRRLVVGKDSGAAPVVSPQSMEQMQRNLIENRAVWQESDYYDHAEQFMQAQWDIHIWPLIQGADFSRTMDLAAGAGRNSELLKNHAKELWVVDINQTNIDRCRERFANYTGPCKLNFAVNDGTSLPMIPTGSLTMIYSFDAMVHFDPQVIRQYVREFARVMAPGASGFCHHSNYGAWAPDPNSNWQSNPHWRSHMTANLFVDFCKEHGLEVTKQVIHGWGGMENLDSFSCFRKPKK
jgi:ubiquinone/menaquinone biosynthesis C-methylase UbiE